MTDKPIPWIDELRSAHATLQKLRELARREERRSVAQQLADTQGSLDEAIAIERARLRKARAK